MHKKIVVAYSGGLATSIAVPWLKEQGAAEVIAVTLDLGQGRVLNQIRDRALAAGAGRCHVLDVREEFARDYILPALQAGASDEVRAPVGALARPLIAKKLVEVARIEAATAVAHGAATGRHHWSPLDVAIRSIDRDVAVMNAAWLADMTPSQQVDYGRVRGLALPPAGACVQTAKQNLWGRSVSCDALQDGWNEPPEDVYLLTKSPTQAPATAAYIEIEWERGVPISVNGVPMAFVELIASLDTIAGVHGVGRVGAVQSGRSGEKSREVHEAPAAVVLQTAHRELENLVTPRRLRRLKQQLSLEYADLVHAGDWFSPARAAIDAFVGDVQQRVTGTVRLKLYKGDCRLVGGKSPFELGAPSFGAREPVAPAAT